MPYLQVKAVAASEGAGTLSFVVTLDAPSLSEVRVLHALLSGTADSNQDVTDLSGTLVFAPGETLKSVQLALTNDADAESTEVLWLDLLHPVNAEVPQRYTPALIFDNDSSAGTPALSVGDAVVNETAQTADFFVSLSRPSATPVTVSYSTGNDTAAAGQDYAAASGSLSFAPGEMVKTVRVNLVNDALAETDERFNFVLANPTGATLADANGAALIARNDTPLVATPQVFSTPITVSEGDTFASFIVQLSAPSMNEVWVNIETLEGTATYGNGQDFYYRNGPVVFAPGETIRTLPVIVSDGALAESSEAFELELLRPGSHAAIAQPLITATIIDNDSGFSVYSYGISHDTYSVTTTLDGIAESVNGGIDTVRSSVSYTLPENVENLVLSGSALNGIGNAGNNVMRGTAADNSFDGQGGIDMAVFSGPLASYTFASSLASITVTGGSDGSDTLIAFERTQFADTLLAADTTAGGNTFLAYAMFNAGFDRAPSTQELSLWTAQLDRLGNLRDLAQTMINYYAPGVPNDALVAHLWGTIVETPIPPDALALFTGDLDNGTYTQASLLELVTTLDLNTVELVGIVGQVLSLDPAFFPPPG